MVIKLNVFASQIIYTIIIILDAEFYVPLCTYGFLKSNILGNVYNILSILLL